MLIHDPAFHMRRRRRRPPDRLNSLLNLSYYLLFSRINTTVRSLGLNPYLGFLHSPAGGYESLVCDVQELFRARMDRLVVSSVNLRVVKAGDFAEREGGYYLKRDALKRYVRRFETEMNRPGGREERLSLKDSIYVQCLAIRNWVRGRGDISLYRWE